MGTMSDSKSNLGLAVQILRKKNKVKQRDIAEACGVGEFNVSRWETGRIPIPSEHLPAICKAVGTSKTKLTRMARLLSE